LTALATTSGKQVASTDATAADGAVADTDKRKEGVEDKHKDPVTLLAEKIRDYILDHQDDVAKEERWRTTMKRDMAKSFRATDSQLTALGKSSIETGSQLQVILNEQRKTDLQLQTILKELHGLRAKLGEQEANQEKGSGAPNASGTNEASQDAKSAD